MEKIFQIGQDLVKKVKLTLTQLCQKWYNILYNQEQGLDMTIIHNRKLMKHSVGTIVLGKDKSGEFLLWKVTKVDRENECYEIENFSGDTDISTDDKLSRASWYFQRFGLKG